MNMVESDIAALIEVFNKLKQNGDKYVSELATSELLTRYVLIDPILRALGWNTEDPRKVWVERKINSRRKKRSDYALICRGKIVAFIEAKSYGTFGSEENEDNILKATRQVATYRLLRGERVPLGIVTDGGSWSVYNLCKRGHRVTMDYFDIDLYSKSPEEMRKNAQEALKLAPTKIMSLARRARREGKKIAT